MRTGGMGLPPSLLVTKLRLAVWANKGKVLAGRFVSVIYFSINQATMRIDLINQTMQIDAGNVGVNVWMFRVISGVRIWHVGDAGNWKNTLSHLPRKTWQVEILKLVNIIRYCWCAVQSLCVCKLYLTPQNIKRTRCIFDPHGQFLNFFRFKITNCGDCMA